MARQRRQYTLEFKQEAVRLIKEQGLTPAQVARGVAQLGRYLDTVGLDQGWLVVFDVRPDRSREDRLWTEHHALGGKPVVVLGA